MVSGEQNVGSPTMKQPAGGVSDQSLSKTRISPSHHNIRSNKSGKSKRKNKLLNLHAYDHHMNNNNGTSNSPYYKGLTDQSLAIVERIPRPQSEPDQFHTPTTTDHHHLHSSPYYKGLLAINITPWTPHDHPISFSPTNSFAYLPSPYYSGLLATDYDYTTLLFHGPSSSSLPNNITLKDLILDASHSHHDVDFLTHHAVDHVMDEAISVLEAKAEKMILDKMVTVEEKPLRERVSERSSEEDVDLVAEMEEELRDDEVYKYTWAAKYQPVSLDDFICNRDKALELEAKVKEGCGCSHFIFEGPPSVGKRSMIRAMLREVFGSRTLQVIEESRNFPLKGEMVGNLQVRLKKSLHHVEVNLSETKGYEKHVISELFKETYGKVINSSEPCCPENCKAIILYEAEKLSIESLLYIKWLLEKYKGCNKVFFCCSDESKLKPVKPLCITVRLSSPSTQQLVQILERIAKEEGVKLSRYLVEKIILRSKNNLRQAIRSLEATCRNKDAIKDDDLILTGWEQDIFNIAKKIAQDQSPRLLYVIRRKLRSLMVHDVPPDFIYKSLISELTNLVDESLRSGVAKLDKEFTRPGEIKFETMKQFGHVQNKQAVSDEKNNDSTKHNRLTYLKVEEFIAKFMSWYKNSSEKDNKQ